MSDKELVDKILDALPEESVKKHPTIFFINEVLNVFLYEKNIPSLSDIESVIGETMEISTDSSLKELYNLVSFDIKFVKKTLRTILNEIPEIFLEEIFFRFFKNKNIDNYELPN